MKHAKKMVCLLLALLMCPTALIACKGSVDTPSTDTTDTDSGEATQDVGNNDDNGWSTDENGYVLDSIPSNLNYGGRDVIIFGWQEGKDDFEAQKDSKDFVDQATFSRNSNVESRLDVTLKFNTETSGNSATCGDYFAKVTNLLGSGYTIDIIGCYSMVTANFAINGYLKDLSGLGMLEIEKPWWYSNLAESATINGALYFMSGTLAATTMLETQIIAVNLELADAYELQDPREIVKTGDWTLTKLFEMTKDVTVDAGDPGVKDSLDTFGFITEYMVFVDGFYNGYGLKMLETSEDGSKLVVSTDYTDGPAEELYSLLKSWFAKPEVWADKEVRSNGEIFTTGRALFMGMSFSYMRTLNDKANFEYGYVPYPKKEAGTDTGYYTTIGFPCSLFGITTGTQDTECAAYVLECLASEGYRTVFPQLEKRYKYQYSDSPLDGEMFEIINSSISIDCCRLYNYYLEWWVTPVAVFRELLIGSRTGGFYSTLENLEARLQGNIDSVNASFADGGKHD